MVLTPSSPEDISLLSVFFRSSKTKRLRQTSSALWELPIVSEINTEFSDPETILLGPETAQLYAAKQDPGSEEASRSQSTVTDDSEQLQTPTDRAGENFSHEHKINSLLHIRTKREDSQGSFTSVELESILSCGSLKGVGAAQKSLLKIIPPELLQHLGEDSRKMFGSDNPGPEMQTSSSCQTFFSATAKPSHLQTRRISTGDSTANRSGVLRITSEGRISRNSKLERGISRARKDPRL